MEKNYFSIVVAVANGNVIGKNNTLPWKNTPEYYEDIKRFKQITSFNEHGVPNIVIMGKNTFNSINKPLPGRINVAISKTYQNSEVLIYDSLDIALNELYKNYDTSKHKIFVIGGECIYKEAILRYDCKNIYLTQVNNTYTDCDTFFPIIPKWYIVKDKIDGNSKSLSFMTYTNYININSEEYQYLNLMTKILNNGVLKQNRTEIPTYSIFGDQIRFNLSNNILPLITTKKMFYRGVVEELLFFIRGDHDNRKLKEKNIHIWDGNTTREYLDKYNKKHIETDDLGLAYGVQWRAAGVKLETINTDYRGKGVDQLNNVINLIKTDPNSRRIIMNAWNVEYLDDMALVPCHIMYQFYVSNNKLYCMMTQRSADVFLGLPFNIASTATLVHILSKVCKLESGEIIINIGDAHIYSNHIEQVKTQLSRKPYYFPKLEIIKELNNIEDMENLTWKDFRLIDYHSYDSIKAEMVI